jgi:outer membrane biosynthesis protein TonB
MKPVPETRRRRRARPGKVAALGSFLVHAACVGLAVGLVVRRPDISQFVSYNIELVSMPGPKMGDLVVEAPDSPPAEAPAPEPQPVVKPPAAKKEAPKQETAKKPEPSKAQPKPTQAKPNPSGGDSTGGDSDEAMNIRIDGLKRDYPTYYNNIILQIKRCFRWEGTGSPEAEIYFVLNGDGTVDDLRFVRKSGNPSFDFGAMGAVECAGKPGRFGSLPKDLPFDRLPIRFTFKPGNVAGIFR